jgi:hypothetical protein
LPASTQWTDCDGFSFAQGNTSSQLNMPFTAGWSRDFNWETARLLRPSYRKFRIQQNSSTQPIRLQQMLPPRLRSCPSSLHLGLSDDMCQKRHLLHRQPSGFPAAFQPQSKFTRLHRALHSSSHSIIHSIWKGLGIRAFFGAVMGIANAFLL